LKKLKIDGGIMPKFKATKKFKQLGIENSYQHLSVEQFHGLKSGGIVEMDLPFRARFLLFEKYIERLPDKPNKNVKGA
jgi:hypothetical protein